MERTPSSAKRQPPPLHRWVKYLVAGTPTVVTTGWLPKPINHLTQSLYFLQLILYAVVPCSLQYRCVSRSSASQVMFACSLYGLSVYICLVVRTSWLG